MPADGQIHLDTSIIGGVIDTAVNEVGVERESVSVELAMEVTWNDGSLGCPQEGQFYTQALVNGYWIILSTGDQVLDYRAGPDAEFSRCMDGNPPVDTDANR